MICPNKFAKEVARASGRKMPNVSDELIKNGFDSVKSGDEIKQINTQKFSSNKVENSNLNALNNSNNEILRMATKAGEYEKVFNKETSVLKEQKEKLGIELANMDEKAQADTIKAYENAKSADEKHNALKMAMLSNRSDEFRPISHVNLSDISDKEAQDLAKKIQKHYSSADFSLYNGGEYYTISNRGKGKIARGYEDIKEYDYINKAEYLAVAGKLDYYFNNSRFLGKHRDLRSDNDLTDILFFRSDAKIHGNNVQILFTLKEVNKGVQKGKRVYAMGITLADDAGKLIRLDSDALPATSGATHATGSPTATPATASNGADFSANSKISQDLPKQADIRGGKAQTAQKQVINEKMTHALPKTSADKQAFIVKNSTTTANKSQEINAVEPIKEFGTNYAEFYHDGANAIRKLLAERQGQVAGAFEREELGDIDLVWGKFEVVKGEIKGYGLSKIEAKHLNDFANFKGDTPQEKLVNGLNEIIENGKIVSDNGINTIIYKKGNNNFRVGLSKGFYNKGDNNWIITAYKVDKVPSSDFLPSSQIAKSDGTNLHSNTLPEVLESIETSYHDTFTAKEPLANQRVNSTTTANKSQENILKGVDGKEYPNSIAGRWEKRVDEAFDWAYKNIYAKGVRSGIKGASKITTFFGGDGDMVSRGLEKTFALQDEIGALSRLKSAYERNNQVARAEAMKVYENLVKLKIEERVALFRMLDGQEVEPNLSQKLRPIYEKLRDKIDERAEQLISLGALKGENAKENYIKYSYSQYYSDGSKGFGIGKLKARNESLSYEDRVKMGLIEDAAVAVTQTLNSQNNQIQKAILFKNLADEYGVNQPKDGYVKVSDESVGGGIKKYGALAGKYVPSAVYDDLQNAGIVSSIFDVIRPYTNVIDHIKVNLTVKNPATHGYNVLSNSVLAFLHGDLGANLKLIKLLATDKKGFDELLAKADAMGLNSANDDIEMRNLLMANDKVAKEAAFSQNPLGYYIAASWQNIYLTQNSTTGRVARSAYAWEDKWFKLARFKKNLDAKMSDEAAFNDANSAYVDYSSHFNPALRLLDKSGVLPFFHFAVKSSIVVTKAAIKNPAKFAMLQTALIGSGASTLPYWFDSEQKDADNSRLPQWASSNYLPNLFGVKNQVQIGDSGLYFNAARAMAGFRLSSIDDITGGGGLVGGLLDILRGRDSWGNDMVGKHDPAIKQLTARLDAFSKQFLPSITLGRYGRQGVAIATGNNPKNAYDEPMGIGELAGRFIGIRMINEKKELRSAAISAKNRYKKAKEKGDEGAMAVALNDYMACKAAASDMGVSLEGLMKMKSKDIK